MTESDTASASAVSAANRAFYAALESGDFDDMREVWSKSDDVVCAHPGRVPLRGWDDVWASWVAILGSGGNPQIILTEEVITVRGDVAWATGIENMISGGHTGAAAALNIFENSNDAWLLVAHYAGPVVADH